MSKKFDVQDGEGDSDVRICSLERYHTDDIEGECEECHRPVFYRPEPPFLIRFLCFECCMPKMMQANTEFRVSTATLKWMNENPEIMEEIRKIAEDQEHDS